MASQPPTPDQPTDVPVDDPIPMPEDPPLPIPSDPVVASSVLVVEDQPLLRMVVTEVLTEAGLTVLEAGDASAALGLFDAHEEIAVIVSDLKLPGTLSGVDLVNRVHESRPGVELVLISGHEAPPSQSIPPAALFVRKPFTAELLTAIVTAKLR